MNIKIFVEVLLIILCISIQQIKAQDCSSCGSVITIDVDLSSNPDTVWISPQIGRNGQCCQGTGSERCIRFNVKTHPDANLLGFTLAEPPIPPAMQYSLNCGTPQSVDIPMCLNGPGPHCIVYCKPGGDLLKYQITTSKTFKKSPNIAVGQGCKDTIWAHGLDPSSIKWNVVYPSSAYNTYLSCTAGCDTVFVGPTSAVFPPYIDVEVSGTLQSACNSNFVKDTVRVFFVSDKAVTIFPPNPTICYGGTSATLTAMPVGGAAPYSYKWNTGETTKSIAVISPGLYSVTVTDTTDCPPVESSVTVVAHTSPITADAGEGNICIDNPSVQLNGSVQVATGGVWSGGGGTFSPDNTTLNAIYTLSPIEISLKSATLTLTTTGNAGCPPSTDAVTITVSPKPTVNAGNDGIVCQSALSIPLNGSITGSSTDGFWTTLGTGTFSDKYDLKATYYPSQADTAAGSVKLILSSIAVGVCNPVTDTLTIFFGNEPTAEFSFTQPACSGQNIQFSDHTIVGWGVVSSWTWNFGDGSTAAVKNPLKAFATPGNYIVKLDVTSDKGCKGTITHTVAVSQDPTAAFTSSHTCFGESTTFTDASQNAASWLWNFGNGSNSIDKNPAAVQYQNAGNYTVSLTVKNTSGCSNTISKTVTVFDNPIADFKTGNVCTGVSSQFNDNSISINDPILSWKWDFGNGSTSALQNPQHTFTTTVAVPVSLIVSTINCADTVIKTINPQKTPTLISNTTAGCAPLGVQFQSPVEPNVSYTWNFGDGSTSIDSKPFHTYLNTGNSTISYNVKNKATSVFGCTDSLTSTVTIYPQSFPSFTLSNNKVCSNSSVTFTNTSQNAISYVETVAR